MSCRREELPQATGYGSTKPSITMGGVTMRHLPSGAYVNVRAAVLSAAAKNRIASLTTLWGDVYFWAFLMQEW